MNLKSFLPAAVIAEYVSSILVIESGDFREEFVLPLYANGSPTIIFQTSNPKNSRGSVDNLAILGHTLLPEELIFKEPFSLIAYFLYPHALSTLFKIKASELTNVCFSLTELKQSRDMNLKEQLLNEPTADGRLELINSFIEGLARKTDAIREKGSLKISSSGNKV